MRVPSPPTTPARRATGGNLGPLAGWALVAVIAAVVLLQGRGSTETIAAEIDLARGATVYAANCAACHGGTGVGGVSGDGTQIRPVIGADRVATIEAIRVGPFRMPRFVEAQLDDQEVADVAVFVDSLQDRARTPLGLSEIDRVAMAVLVVPLLLACVGVTLLVGRPVDAARPPHERPVPDGALPPDDPTAHDAPREIGI